LRPLCLLALFCLSVQHWLSGTAWCHLLQCLLLTGCLARFSICAILHISLTVAVVWLVTSATAAPTAVLALCSCSAITITCRHSWSAIS
jgi:hypothetical protein